METLTLRLSTLYADHHVLEVRRLLLTMPGVSDVYASSAFQTVEVCFDPAQVSAESIEHVLEENGYMGELPVPAETGIPSQQMDQTKSYFRHTEVYENVRSVMSFTQNVAYRGRPLWPCPGMGPIANKKQEEE
jgi:copper chaperone CopZ